MKAFVSFVRSYSKHEASYIFRLSELNLASVAIAYGLLRLPRMPELAEQDLSKWKDAEVDVSLPPLPFVAHAFSDHRRSISGTISLTLMRRAKPSAVQIWRPKRKSRKLGPGQRLRKRGHTRKTSVPNKVTNARSAYLRLPRRKRCQMPKKIPILKLRSSKTKGKPSERKKTGRRASRPWVYMICDIAKRCRHSSSAYSPAL